MPGLPALKRVAHDGVELLAAGLLAAADIDMLELDVLSERPDGSGRLLLAHDYDEAGRRPSLTLDEGLDLLTEQSLDGLELDIDLKLPGYEVRVVDELRARNLIDRTLVSSMDREGLARIRAVEPGLRLGWSVPRVRRDWTSSRLTLLPALWALQAMKRALPARAARALRRREIDAVMAYWRLVSPRLVDAVRDAGGELYAWTVDDAVQMSRLEALGVSAIITNEPRLFAPAGAQRSTQRRAL